MAESRAIIGIETNHAASPVRGAINLHQIKVLAYREMEGLTTETRRSHLKTSLSLSNSTLKQREKKKMTEDWSAKTENPDLQTRPAMQS